MKATRLFILFAASILLMGCPSKKLNTISLPESFVRPAFKNVNIQLDEFDVVAEKGDTIYYKTGSIIVFPENAFVDKNGKCIKGNVKIQYREFADPIDFFISGIPMDYDSAGINYNFESSGMCEIKAFNGNEPVFVNPKNKPEINLISKNADLAHNLYFLDTVKKKWIFNGKSIITDLGLEQNNSKPNNETIKSEKLDIPAPIKPIKADGKRPFFSIKINPASVSELQAYNNLKFEIIEGEKTYNPKDAQIEWDDVKVEQGSKVGTYIVSFLKGKRKVSHITRPVFEGKDYDEAMKVFKLKQEEYNKLLGNRLEKERVANEKFKKEKAKIDSINKIQEEQNARIIKLNALIDAKNQESAEKIKKYKKERDSINQIRRIEAEKNKKEYLQKIKENEKNAYINGGASMNNEIYRTFAISGFGTWNCDNPLYYRGMPVSAEFYDEDSNKLTLSSIAVVTKKYNGIKMFYSNNIELTQNEIMIWGVIGNKFVYLSYEDFKKYSVTSEKTKYKFIMRIHPKEIKSSDDIRKIVGL